MFLKFWDKCTERREIIYTLTELVLKGGIRATQLLERKTIHPICVSSSGTTGATSSIKLLAFLPLNKYLTPTKCHNVLSRPIEK